MIFHSSQGYVPVLILLVSGWLLCLKDFEYYSILSSQVSSGLLEGHYIHSKNSSISRRGLPSLWNARDMCICNNCCMLTVLLLPLIDVVWRQIHISNFSIKPLQININYLVCTKNVLFNWTEEKNSDENAFSL